MGAVPPVPAGVLPKVGLRPWRWVAVVVLPLAALGALSTAQRYRSDRRDVDRRALAGVEAAAANAERVVADRIAFLEAVARTEAIVVGDDQAKLRLLADLRGDGALFDGVGWVRPDGRGVVVPGLSPEQSAALDLSGRDYVRAVQQTHRPFVSAGLIGLPVRAPEVIIAAPDLDQDGNLRGIVTGVVFLHVLGPPLQALTSESEASIVDRAGQVIVGPQPVERLEPVAEPALFDELRAAGRGVRSGTLDLAGREDRLVAFDTVSGADWLVVTSMGTAEAYSPARASFRLGMATLVTLTAFLLAVAAVLGRRQARSLRTHLGRTARYAEASAAMASAASVEEVLAVYPAHAGPGLGAGTAALVLVGGPRAPGAAAGAGPPGLLHGDGPAADAVATGGRVQARSPEEIEARYPAAAAALRAAGVQAVAAVPLPPIAESPPGAGVVGFSAPRELPEEDWQLLEAVTENAGQALARAFLHESERQRTLRLERQEEALHRANADLEAFASSVAHDLRAPLRAIDGFSQILAEEAGPSLDDKGRATLDRIRSTARRMLGLIEDLLTLARIGRAATQRERVDLSALAARVMDDLRRDEPGRPADVVVAAGLVVDADPSLTEVLVTNLLSNAWKFTARVPRAVISVGAVSGSPGWFYVRDNGAGFDMNYAEKLFQPFQRLHSREEFEGTGVGLASVARIAARHGGAVKGFGEVGRGAVFLFSLSEAAAPLPAAAADLLPGPAAVPSSG